MPTFGQPKRSATKDANAGVVNPPSVKHTARQVATRQQIDTSDNDGIEAFGRSMGTALAARLKEEAVNINEQRATDAAIRQGQDHAINQIDKASKRTGWEKAIYGESIEYRVAQQRAAENAVQALYLEQATVIDDYAGEVPEEYSKRLKSGLDKILEPYGDDVETKKLVTKTYQTAAAKLSAKHYESHYAYNQQQHRETTYNRVLQTFDQWQVDKDLLSSQEEAQGYITGITKFFKGETKPVGMTDIAWKGVVNEALITSLRSGNIGAYNAAKNNGWLDRLSAKDRVAFDQAISAYDTDFSQKVQLAFENSELAALEAPDMDTAKGIYLQLRSEIDQLATRSSGTERANLALARGHTGAQKDINAIDKAKAKALEKAKEVAKKAAEKAAEHELEQQRIDAGMAALREKDPVARAAALTELDFKASELKDIQDATIVEDVGRLMGQEGMTQSEAVKALMSEPQVAKHIATRLRGSQVDSPLVKRVLETFLNGYHTLTNPETNQLNEQGVVAMQSVSQFAQNEDTFKSMVGASNYDKYEIIRRGLAAGQTVDMVQKDVDAYFTNKGNRDQYQIDWNLRKDESKRDRVTSLYQRFTGKTPTAAALAYAQEEIDRGLIVSKGDMGQAEQYLKTSLQNSSINYRGRTMLNAKHLNDVTSYNFEQLIDGAQNSTNGVNSLLTPFLLQAGMRDTGDTAPMKLEDDMNIFVVDGTDGFFIDSPRYQRPVRISTDVMKAWAQVLDQRTKQKAMEEKSYGENLDSWLTEQDELQKYAPYGAGF